MILRTSAARFGHLTLAEMPDRIERVARGIAQSAYAELEIEGRLRRHALALVGAEHIFGRRIAGLDDVAYFLENAPGCYSFPGGAEPSKPIQQHHQARFRIDESVMPLGLELALRVIDDFLS